MFSQQKIKHYAKLRQKKYRSLYDQFIVEGIRGISDLLNTSDRHVRIEAVVYTDTFAESGENQEILRLLESRGIQSHEVEKKILEKIADTVTSQHIVAIVNQWHITLETIPVRGGKPLMVALDRIAEPGNLGAIIRTCDWFGVDAVLLGRGCVEIWNPKVVRASVGSMTHIPFVEDVDLEEILDKLKSEGYRIVGAETHGGISLTESVPTCPCVLVFGSEAEGIDGGIRRQLDSSVTVPRYGKAESLNVGVAAGIILSVIRSAGV